MFYGFDGAATLDKKAFNITEPSFDHVAYDLDKKLWMLLQLACQNNASATADIFSLSQRTVKEIASATTEKLSRLFLGAVPSFGIKNLQEITPRFEVILSRNIEEFNLSYSYCFEINFLHAIRLMALKDLYTTQAKTGIPIYILEKIINASEATLESLADCGIEFHLLCSEEIIFNILSANDDNLIQNYQLRKIQQCLTTHGKQKLYPVPALKFPLSKTNVDLIGKLMFVTGFTKKIIGKELLLTNKQVLRIYTSVLDDGVKINNPSSRVARTSATLIRGYAGKIQAAIIAQLYINLGGEDVFRRTNINALIRAYRIYKEILQEQKHLDAKKYSAIDIKDAYSFISELRSTRDAGMISFCKNCKTSYFSSIEERTFIECPFCYVPKDLFRKYKEHEQVTI